MKISVKLSTGSVNQAIKQIEQYRKSIYTKQQLFMTKLSLRGYEIMIEQIGSYSMPYSEGDLISGCSFQYSQTHCSIYCVSDHAVYVEFGTGIVGKGSPHSEAGRLGYAYDVNDHGDNGWYYYKNGERHFTKGMPARPFVHKTYEKLRTEIVEIAKEVFSSD